MTSSDPQRTAIRRMLDARQARRDAAEAEREALQELKRAVRAALDAGVPGNTIANELLRDSAAHGELEGLAERVIADIRQQTGDERIPEPHWPGAAA